MPAINMWTKLPGLTKEELEFNHTISWYAGSNLGCHTQWVADLYRTDLSATSTAHFTGPGAKEIKTGPYSEILWGESFGSLEAFRRARDKAFASIRDQMLKKLVDLFRNGSYTAALVFMSGPVNFKSNPERSSHDLTVAGLVQWLMDNKIGYVIQGPVTTNRNYLRHSNHSLCRGWIWVTPEGCKRSIRETVETAGEENLVTFEKFKDTTAKDFFTGTPYDKLAKTSRDLVDQRCAWENI